ncbi:MAG: polysaccharide lyase family 1 protein [Bacteroidaceae bacterium]
MRTKTHTWMLAACAALLLAQTAAAQLSAYDQNRPLGFGEKATGGKGGASITVTTASELKSALKGTLPLIIYVDGAIEVSSMISAETSNKTVLGLPGSYLYNNNRTRSGSGILYLKRCNNIILRNLTFKSAGAYDVDGNDNLCLDNSTTVWVDHCDFQDGVDGNFDCKAASDNVCVTWCRFRYLIEPQAGGSGGSNDHRFSNLWGSSDSATGDRGHLNTTFQFCAWEDCAGRMPRVRFGHVHLANCYYAPKAGANTVQCGNESSLLIENCHFEGAQQPWADYTNNSTFGLKESGSLMEGCTRPDFYGTGDTFTPSYETPLTLVEAKQVKTIVFGQRGAGATLTVEEEKGVIGGIDEGETGGGESGGGETPEPTTTGNWDFTAWSSASLTALQSDAAWNVVSDTRVSNATSMSGTIMAGGKALAETEGLTFGTLAADKLRLNYGDPTLNAANLQLNGSRLSITVPGCKRGDIIRVDYASANNTAERGWESTVTQPGSQLTIERTSHEFNVTSDADVTLTTTGGLLVFGIQRLSSATSLQRTESQAAVVHVEYYNAAGMRLNAPTRGLNVVRTLRADGTVDVEKYFR